MFIEHFLTKQYIIIYMYSLLLTIGATSFKRLTKDNK